jgi:hypothetical protein
MAIWRALYVQRLPAIPRGPGGRRFGLLSAVTSFLSCLHRGSKHFIPRDKHGSLSDVLRDGSAAQLPAGLALEAMRRYSQMIYYLFREPIFSAYTKYYSYLCILSCNNFTFADESLKCVHRTPILAIIRVVSKIPVLGSILGTFIQYYNFVLTVNLFIDSGNVLTILLSLQAYHFYVAASS